MGLERLWVRFMCFGFWDMKGGWGGVGSKKQANN